MIHIEYGSNHLTVNRQFNGARFHGVHDLNGSIMRIALFILLAIFGKDDHIKHRDDDIHGLQDGITLLVKFQLAILIRYLLYILHDHTQVI